MSNQITKVDLIPNGELSVCNVSQFDNGRVLPFEILENKEAYNIPSGITVELQCRKADGNIVTLAADTITDNIVTFISTTQLTACYGKNLCEISLIGEDDYLIGSANFYLDVEKSPTLGGITSTSEIHNLEEQIRDIAEDVIPEILPGLMGDYYTKEEVDDLLIGILPTDEVTGNPATFNTQIATPLVNVSCDIVASGGGGTPASPVPIVGYSQANINANGNISTIAFGQTVYGGVLDVTRGKLHVTHKIVDLGALSWTYRNDTNPNAPYFYASTPSTPDNIKYKGAYYSTNYGLLCSIYSCVARGNFPNTDFTMCVDGSGNTPSQFQIKNSNYTDASSFTTAMDGIILVYELATPFDIDLTPEVISAVVGANIVSSDTGPVTVRFKTTIEDYINSRLNTNSNRLLLSSVNSDIIKEKSEIKDQSDIIEDIERGEENE